MLPCCRMTIDQLRHDDLAGIQLDKEQADQVLSEVEFKISVEGLDLITDVPILLIIYIALLEIYWQWGPHPPPHPLKSLTKLLDFVWQALRLKGGELIF